MITDSADEQKQCLRAKKKLKCVIQEWATIDLPAEEKEYEFIFCLTDEQPGHVSNLLPTTVQRSAVLVKNMKKHYPPFFKLFSSILNTTWWKCGNQSASCSPTVSAIGHKYKLLSAVDAERDLEKR